ncbi:SDR family oxidoreductase [Thermopetrobacter sp. TC1]|uniref:SDR family NAD(P)-dependent oxidoreductase n=1 Tax=Thermopetrobacter sp. TC1 TaxID=1495045 RepID=UPI00068F9355|nr:SDR family oxidoreductase [Thermopetrobacter sp. TC1]
MNRIWSTQEKRRALITGASSGIGEAFARLLAEEHWDLVLIARREEELYRIKGVLQAEHPITVHVLPADLSRKDAPDHILHALEERGFVPDVLINNAGFGRAGPAHVLNADEQLAIVDVNVRAATALALKLLPRMVERGMGGIINVASLAGFMPGPGMAVYFATKAYLLSFSEALHEEMRDHGITITALCPGPVRTGFQAASGMDRLWLTKVLPMAKAEQIARAGWQGFKEGRAIVIPGLFHAFTVQMGRISPRVLTRRIVKRLLLPRRRLKLLKERKERKEIPDQERDSNTGESGR